MSLFISGAIKQQKIKYCYGKMDNQQSIKPQKILLPSLFDKPNYKFIEKY